MYPGIRDGDLLTQECQVVMERLRGVPADLLILGCRAQDGCSLAWTNSSQCYSLSTQLQNGAAGAPLSLSPHMAQCAVMG